MQLPHTINQAFVVIALLTALPLFSYGIRREVDCTLLVEPTETVAEVLARVEAAVIEQEIARGTTPIDPAAIPQAYDVQIQRCGHFLNSPVTMAVIRKPRKEARSYAAGINEAEGSDIAYIVKTLANSSLPKIKIAETALKKAGDRIDQVHPLQFLIYVFSDEELKVCLKNLVGRTFVWKDFINGITETLAEENKKGNIEPYLSDFAQKIQIDLAFLTPLQQGGRWEKFVIGVIDMVPRDGNITRHNQ